GRPPLARGRRLKPSPGCGRSPLRTPSLTLQPPRGRVAPALIVRARPREPPMPALTIENFHASTPVPMSPADLPAGPRPLAVLRRKDDSNDIVDMVLIQTRAKAARCRRCPICRLATIGNVAVCMPSADAVRDDSHLPRVGPDDPRYIG